ncbi:MAG: TadE/TadG family type IV pilus assembly protein [Chloroflexia bacterium]
MRHKGQALVEFAVVIGVTLLLAIGAVQALHAYYLTRQTRAAAEEIASLAAAHGGDTEEVRARAAEILSLHRLDPARAELEIVPPLAPYLEPITVTLSYQALVRFYGLFDLPIPPQRVLRLSEGG